LTIVSLYKYLLYKIKSNINYHLMIDKFNFRYYNGDIINDNKYHFTHIYKVSQVS